MPHFAICNLGEVFIPGSDRVEGLGRGQADDFVSFLAQRVAGSGRAYGHGHYDAPCILLAKRPNRGQHRAARRQTIVDNQHVPAMNIDQGTFPAIQAAAPFDLALFARGDFFNDLRTEFAVPDKIGVDHAQGRVGARRFSDRPEAKFRLPGYSELADQKHVERSTQ